MTSLQHLFQNHLHGTSLHILAEANHSADRLRVPVTSIHILHAILLTDCPARAHLLKPPLSLHTLLDVIDLHCEEPPEVVERLCEEADKLSSNAHHIVRDTHILAGLLRYHTFSEAIHLLSNQGCDTSRVRNRLLVQLEEQHHTPPPPPQPPSQDFSSPFLSTNPAPHTPPQPPSPAYTPPHWNEPNPIAPPQSWEWNPPLPANPQHVAASLPPLPAYTEPYVEPYIEPTHPQDPHTHHHPPADYFPPAPYTQQHAPPTFPAPTYTHDHHPPVHNEPTTHFPYPAYAPPQPVPPPPQPRTSPSQSRGVRALPSTKTRSSSYAPTTHPQPTTRSDLPKVPPKPKTTIRRPASPPQDRAPKKNKPKPRKANNPLALKLRGRFGSRSPRHRSVEDPSLEGLAASILPSLNASVAPPPQNPPKRRMSRKERERLAAQRRRNPQTPPSPPPSNPSQNPETPKTPKPPSSSLQKLAQSLPSASSSTIRTRKPKARPRPPVDHAKAQARFGLDNATYPFLHEFADNITLDAALGEFDALVGREKEISDLVDILNKRRNNNPLLIGPPGVGKTSIVEGLALDLARDRNLTRGLPAHTKILAISLGRLLSGTHLRGSLSERLNALRHEVTQAKGSIILFLDELHTWIGAGSGGDGTDVASELKNLLEHRHFPCIGITTEAEYKRCIENDPALKRRFQVVEVAEPTRQQTVDLIHGNLAHYSKHHDVAYDDTAIEACVILSQRYIPEERLPEKALNLLDLAGSYARREGNDRVDRDVIARVVSKKTGVPVDKLLMRDRDRLLRMEEIISASLIGHQSLVHRLCQVIRRNYAGFHSGRPIGSFLFLGPTGVGKTELVKVLSEFLFRDKNAVIRLDMSEFHEAHTVSRLVGAPPGFVGYEQGGQLTDAVRKRPYSVVLFDEIEKAHPDVLNILLQLLDDGRLTDGRGRTVDFSNTVVVLTSNLGSKHFSDALAVVSRNLAPSEPTPGLVLTPELRSAVIQSARSALTPELWNRIDERLVFGPLSRFEVARIASLLFNTTARQLQAEKNIIMEADSSVFEYLIDHGGYDPELGARPMRQALQRFIQTHIAELILQGELSDGQSVHIQVFDAQLEFTIYQT